MTAFTGVSSDKWLQAIVQKVTDFGLFARPAGFDTAGTHYFFGLDFIVTRKCCRVAKYYNLFSLT